MIGCKNNMSGNKHSHDIEKCCTGHSRGNVNLFGQVHSAMKSFDCDYEGQYAVVKLGIANHCGCFHQGLKMANADKRLWDQRF